MAQFVSIWEDIPGRSKRLRFASYDISMIIGTCLACFDLLNGIWLNVGQILLQRAPTGAKPVAHGWQDLPSWLKRFRCAVYFISMKVETC